MLVFTFKRIFEFKILRYIMPNMRPLIGITLDYVLAGSFSPRPHYAIRDSYFNAVEAAGGTPIGIPFMGNLIDDYLSVINALVVPGGDFALNSNWYVKDDKPGFPPTPRLEFDVEIITKALRKKIPLLGICAGMQIMGGMHGSKLTSNINKYVDSKLCHLKGTDAAEYAHEVRIEKNSLLRKIVGADAMQTNSRHIEGIVEPSDNVVVTAKSDDGVVEAIELKGYDFALGVQWHPEFFIQENEPNFKIFQALVKASA